MKELYELRAKAVHDARQILERAEREKRDLNSEELAAYERADAEIDRVDEQIRKHEQKLASKNRQIPASNPTDKDGNQRKQPLAIEYDAGWNVPQMLRGRKPRRNVISTGSQLHLRSQDTYRQAFLRYIQTGREQLGLVVGKDTKGGYLAPTQWASELIKAVDDMVHVRQLARVLPPLSDAVSIGIPSRDSRLSSSDWTAEIPASDISEDDSLTFGKRELTPHLLTKLVKVSNKMLRSSSIDAESFVREEQAYIFGATLENAYYTGTGHQQPLGMFVASDLGVPTSRDVTTASSTTFTAEELIDLLYNLKEQYQRNAVGIFSRTAVKVARKLKTGDGQYLWMPGLAGTPNTILDRPYIQSEYVPSTFTAGKYVAMFADLQAGYWIVDSLNLEIQVLAELFLLRNQVGFLGRMESDGMPVLAEAFSRLKLKP